MVYRYFKPFVNRQFDQAEGEGAAPAAAAAVPFSPCIVYVTVGGGLSLHLIDPAQMTRARTPHQLMQVCPSHAWLVISLPFV